MTRVFESGSTETGLHPRLVADCHLLGRSGNAWLLVSREAALHWFLLVPDTDCSDLLDMPVQARNALMDSAARLSAVLKNQLGYPKVNLGALGNVVPQLHLHVVGRHPDDFCWPDPVWGRSVPGTAYSNDALQALRQLLCTATLLNSDG